MEIFDYFNKGIIDSIGPELELDEEKKKILHELEWLNERVNIL